MKTTITLFKGGAAEKTVELSKVIIPDLWKVAQIEELKGYSIGDKSAKEMILECWHLAHQFKKDLERKADLLEACKAALAANPYGVKFDGKWDDWRDILVDAISKAESA